MYISVGHELGWLTLMRLYCSMSLNAVLEIGPEAGDWVTKICMFPYPLHTLLWKSTTI